MGNNRQQLRDNLAKDIQAKIAATKIVLTQLQESIETVEKNAVEVSSSSLRITKYVGHRVEVFKFYAVVALVKIVIVSNFRPNWRWEQQRTI